MSSGLKIFAFLLFLLPLAALGHDAYYAYYSDDEKREAAEALEIDPQAFRLSDAGYLWRTYSPGTFEGARESVSPGLWTAYVDPVLEQAAVLVAAVPVFLLFCFTGLRGLVRRGQSRRVPRAAPESYGVYDKQTKGQQMKYKRR